MSPSSQAHVPHPFWHRLTVIWSWRNEKHCHVTCQKQFYFTTDQPGHLGMINPLYILARKKSLYIYIYKGNVTLFSGPRAPTVLARSGKTHIP